MQQKEIYERFRCLSDKYGRWEVWADFITLSVVFALLTGQREQEYAEVVKRYTEDDIKQFAQMLVLTVEALDRNPGQDFLGDLFMRFDLSNTWKGQFFTPYCVCRAMSAMTIGDLSSQLKTKSWVSVNDPACGACALLIAFAQECLRQKVNYQQSVLFVAQDIDRIAAMFRKAKIEFWW